MNKTLSILLILSFFCIDNRAQTPISESFELRYFTPDARADGETDFKGETEYFNTNQRIEYLRVYEEYARSFFDNPNWNKLVISDKEAKIIASGIKPQPLPRIRNRMLLEDWKCLGYKEGQHIQSRKDIEQWNSYKNVTVWNESLLFKESTSFSLPIPEQSWRSLFEISIFLPENSLFEWSIGEAITVTQKNIPTGRWIDLKIDLDIENEKYNLIIDGENVAVFAPINKKKVNTLNFQGGSGVRIDNIHCVQYTKGNFTKEPNSRDIPFYSHTFLMEDFKVKPEINGWQNMDYDDTLWDIRQIPFPHGGERFKDETLYMRKIIDVSEFKVAELNIETIDPGGEVWINGEVVEVTRNRHPVKIDISNYLNAGTENIIGIRVYPNQVEHTNRHTSSDIYTGVFAGRAWIDFRDDRYIEDVFAFTKSISDSAATIRLEVGLKNDDWQFEEREPKKMREFNGNLNVRIFKWFPEEGPDPVVQKNIPVNLRLYRDVSIEKEIVLESPELWTYHNPNLYKIVCTLEDASGVQLDDEVITTGVRTISQDGGTFRINRQPEMLNGALWFGYKYPLKDIARTIRCAEEYWMIKAIEMVKRMNGNTIRMSVHHGMRGGINDPRLAEIGDQLGIMFQWTTSTWIRTATPWALDFEGLSRYVKQVRNHPSIIMWQVGNHPLFKNYEDEGLEWMTRVYDQIYPNDPSRLIVPVGAISRLGNGIPNDAGTMNLRGDTLKGQSVWIAPMLCRGNFDHTTGYGADWEVLRKYPYPKNYEGDMGWRETGFRTDYLKSMERAYFDFESEESIGQPNWELRRGKPSYQVKSYELRYDEGSIGRQLSVDEWRISQAWQAFSGYEAYRKKRWLDYDGMAWCTLHGGGNNSTYLKPLIDYYGFAKISWYTIGMAFQPLLAGSGNVDLVYSKADRVPIIIMNLGSKMEVNLELNIKTPEGKIVERKRFKGISVPGGRTLTKVTEWDPDIREEGFYIFEYKLFYNE